jgi:hypothetical protein
LFSVFHADLRDEVKALQQWVNNPFSAVTLETERDAKLIELLNPEKGEFETTAQFELRKQEINTRKLAINKEYEQKVADARTEYDKCNAKLRVKINYLLTQSRETITMQGTLGSYDADTQKYRVSIPQRSFEIVVPLDKAPQVKSTFSSYQLKVSRQLNEKLEWDYLEAKLSGSAGEFSSTDKAPGISTSGTIASLVPPQLDSKLSFSESSGNNMLDAEETASLSIELSNTGKGSGYMVQANIALTGVSGIEYDKTIYFGELAPGKSLSKNCQIKGWTSLAEGTAQLIISFSEQNGFPPDDKVIQFSTLALRPPDTYIAETGINDYNQNNKIEPGEQVEVTVRLHNRGTGLAKGVAVEVKRGEGVYFTPETPSGTFNLGDIASGAYKDIVFHILTAKTATKLELSLDIRENRSQFSRLAVPLNLAFNKVERSADQMVITGKDTYASIASAPMLTADVDKDIPQRGKPDKNRWGVIIGIETYRHVSPVRYAIRDASIMREYFQKVLGIPSENLYIKTDDAATSGEFNTLFNPNGWLAKNASGLDSEIYVYYSGHGAPDPTNNRAYLLPYDANPNYASETGYELNQLYSNLGKLKAKQVTLFLDSCFSGANRDNEIILASARPVFISTPLPSVSANLAVFSAASGAQISSGYSDMQHGLFSYYLMKGLKGDADYNGDKKLSQKELADYLSENVSPMARRMGREQDPQLQSGDPNKVLLQW